MAIKVGDKVRDTATKEEGVVIAISNNTPDCIVVRFRGSLNYVIDKKKLELIAVESPTEVRRPWKLGSAQKR